MGVSKLDTADVIAELEDEFAAETSKMYQSEFQKYKEANCGTGFRRGFFRELAKEAEKKFVMDNNAAQEKGGKSYSIPTTKIVHIMRGSQVGALRQKREKYWKTKG
jgi:hypothetical protein